MELRHGFPISFSWRKLASAFTDISDRWYRGAKRLVLTPIIVIPSKVNSVGVRMGLGIGTLLASLLILGVFFSLLARSTSEDVQRLVTLQDPKSDATYKMKFTLMDTSLAVLSYLQDRERLYLTRIANDQRDFELSFKSYIKMTLTPQEKASGAQLQEAYVAWMAEIDGLILIRDKQYEKTQSFLKDLDVIDGLLNKKIQEGTQQRHWVPSRKLQEIAALDITVEDLRKNVVIYLADPEIPYERRIRKDLRDFASHVKAYETLTLEPNEQEWAQNLHSQFNETSAATREIMGLAKIEAEKQENFVQLRRQLDEVLNDQIQLPLEMKRALGRAILQKKLTRDAGFVFIFVLGTVFLGLIVGIITTRSITQPVERLMTGTEAVARGDLAYRVGIESKDELGRLAGSFNRMLEALQRNSQELERSNKELEEFAYAASHDLQEPMRKIANYTELLERRSAAQADDISRKYMATIIGGSTRMINLIHDLLSYSRISQDELVLATVDMNFVVRQAISDLEILVQESGAAISSDPLPTVTVNQGQMQELFQNLISNAIKFHGPELPQVHISAQRVGRVWKFSIKDNGIGIALEHAKRIFLIFQRLHSKAEYPGTGIGLAICRKIVERHSGRIWVESELGKGSVFNFTLPFSPVKEKP